MSEHRAPWRRRRRGRPWVFGLIVIQLIAGHFAHVDPWALPLLLAGPAILAFRPTRVEFVAVVTFAALALGQPGGPFLPSSAIAIIYAITNGRRLAAWLSIACVYAGWLGLILANLRHYQGVWGELRWVGLALWAGAIGEFADSRRHRVAAYRKLYEEERKRREEQERLQIARELHDVLAHSLSLIAVRASVALELIDTHPDEVRSALVAIKQASKSGLDEVRTVLHGLRDDAPRAPAPDLGQLDELVSSVPGLTVTLTRSGVAQEVPAAIGLAAYRIIQEALTNVVRHSKARQAVVHVHQSEYELLMGIHDDGPAGEATEPGHGIAGIQERVAVLGGVADIGPGPGGGFTVYVALPLRGTK